MADFQFSDYFEHDVLSRRPYLTKEMCIRVVQNPIRSEPQEQTASGSGQLYPSSVG
jgi:hypothetical protein